MSYLFFNCINLSQAVVELLSYIHILTTDGQTRCLSDDHFQQVVQCVEGKSDREKQHTVPKLRIPK